MWFNVMQAYVLYHWCYVGFIMSCIIAAYPTSLLSDMLLVIFIEYKNQQKDRYWKHLFIQAHSDMQYS